MYGHARDLASEAAGSARDTASSFEKLLRNTIDTIRDRVRCSRNWLATGQDAPSFVADRMDRRPKLTARTQREGGGKPPFCFDDFKEGPVC